MGRGAGAGADARRCHPIASGRHRPGRRPSARGRSDRGGSVGPHRRIAARHAKAGRRRLLRIDRSPGRDRRPGLRHGRQDLFRQDRRAGAGGPYGQPLPARRAEDRQLPDRPRGGPGRRDHRCRARSRRSVADHLAVRPGADRRGDPGGDAHGAIGDHGRRRAPPGQEGSHRHPTVGDRGTGRRRHPVLGQDRHPDPEQADLGRSVLSGRDAP